jgi:transposase
VAGTDCPPGTGSVVTCGGRRWCCSQRRAYGFGSLYPKYKGGRPPKFALPQRREMKKVAKSRPAEHDLPFSTWSLPKLAEFLVAQEVIDDISHEGLRALLREEGVTFQRLKTWKASKDPDYAVRKARVEHLYAIADREVIPDPGEPEVIFCVDEFGPLNLQPHPGRQWAAISGKNKEPGRKPRPRRRATYPQRGGAAPVRCLSAGRDKLYAGLACKGRGPGRLTWLPAGERPYACS